jgi:hypothetical protein
MEIKGSNLLTVLEELKAQVKIMSTFADVINDQYRKTFFIAHML